MKDRNCYDCMYSYKWDFDGTGFCLYNRYKVVVKDTHVCRHHRYDEDDKGDKELLFIPQTLN